MVACSASFSPRPILTAPRGSCSCTRRRGSSERPNSRGFRRAASSRSVPRRSPVAGGTLPSTSRGCFEPTTRAGPRRSDAATYASCGSASAPEQRQRTYGRVSTSTFATFCPSSGCRPSCSSARRYREWMSDVAATWPSTSAAHVSWSFRATTSSRWSATNNGSLASWRRSSRVFATVLFTDIVDATAHAADLGDRAWRELLQKHHEVVRSQLSRFRGREKDTAGDGFFATFDGPARGIRCACASRDSLRELDLESRAGLHTGECELVDGKTGGIAVHMGARVASQAAPN